MPRQVIVIIRASRPRDDRTSDHPAGQKDKRRRSAPTQNLTCRRDYIREFAKACVGSITRAFATAMRLHSSRFPAWDRLRCEHRLAYTPRGNAYREIVRTLARSGAHISRKSEPSSDLRRLERVDKIPTTVGTLLCDSPTACIQLFSF